ncbi:hypothetical protein TIFTF001_020013 [Ficus carica]|uniref:Uncharacterized protein n=1 Tax=Ficus carica TaxID=3494 RepID=A0AA88D9F8_FICCA|nr:hypothetical protein TIFTF001_020013 [Ficus carica]
MGLIEDLNNLYPELRTPSERLSDRNEASTEQGLAYLCEALKSIGDSWMANKDRMDKPEFDFTSLTGNFGSYRLAETAAKLLDFMINMAREKFDMMDEDDRVTDYYSSSTNSFGKILSGSYSENNSSCSSSPVTPTSMLPELTCVDSSSVEEIANFSYTPPLLLSLRVQVVKKLNPIDLKYLKLHFSRGRVLFGTILTTAPPPPPPPPIPIGSRGASPPPPPIPLGSRGTPPPTPPVGAARSLRPKKANTKPKRSSQMGNLYRTSREKWRELI